MLTVEVLGPLRVSVEGRPVELPAGRLRALLAVLAMSAGHVVLADRLATAVWGPDPGVDPRANVRTNIKRLRRTLGAADRLILARPGGYLLALEPDLVDALRFGRLLDEARAAPGRAAERTLLIAALALWRGTPFDGIRSDWLEQSVAPALQERYLTALERRIDLDLALGSDTDPAEPARLTKLAERYPLRESLWVRLLRVLEAAGRPAEALERYETIRRRLAEELGTDPSPQLRQVHADLLAGHASFDDATTGNASPGGRSVPRQLPAAVEGFAGREAELAALDALLRERDKARSPLIVAIAGTAGVGKTSLAVHWAHRIASQFPDGQLYVTLRGYDPSGRPLEPNAAIREFLAALQVPPHRIPEDPAAQAALYRSQLAGRHVLILLDDARDTDQVAPLLPGEPGCTVVVTSRDQPAGLVMAYGARPLTLDVLPPDEARRLLIQRLGPDRIAADPAATEVIVRRCAGLPLALAIVAARAAIHPSHPLSALAGELREALGALDQAANLRAIFSWSYNALEAEAARLFRLVGGLHPGPDCSVTAAASLAGAPPRQVRTALSEVARANLLTESTPGRFSCHDLLRAYAAELCEAYDEDRDAALHRLVDHYVHSAHDAAQHLHGHVETIDPAPPVPGVSIAEFAGSDEAMAWLSAEQSTLLAILKLAREGGHDRQVGQLAGSLSYFLHRRGRWYDLAETQRAAVAAARRLGEPAEEARALRDLAWALADLGHFDDAHLSLDTALELSQDDRTAQAWIHYHRDLVYSIQGREIDALDSARRAHDLFDELGDQVGQAVTLTELGWHHGRLGNPDLALNYCEPALAMHQRLGNRQYEAHTWSCLAEVLTQLRDLPGAIECFRRSAELFDELGDLYAQASVLAHVGVCHLLAGDDGAAHECWGRAHALLDQLDSSTIDQIHTQLTTIDKSAADAFLLRRHLDDIDAGSEEVRQIPLGRRTAR